MYNSAFSQNYRNPLDIPMYLSGSFAELRSNHFHSGIDIKTQGREGFPVFAVADGWVSRVKVSPIGFGTALYIQHNNGYTSVYAHLSRYNKTISDYVLEEQYRRKTYAVDLYLNKGLFPVNVSDVVAYTGNTGSSGGPHLHFEMRKTVDQKPCNPLQFNFDVKDNLSPIFSKLSVLENGKTSVYNINKQNASTYHLDTIYVTTSLPKLALSIDDYSNGSSNHLGVNTIEYYLNEELQYAYRNLSFSFSESRYVNAHIDYKYYVLNKERFQKLYIENGNKLSTYSVNKKNDILGINECKKVRIRVYDSKNNKSTFSFFLKRIPASLLDITNRSNTIFRYNKVNVLKNDLLSLSTPIGAFYSNFYFDWDIIQTSEYIGGMLYKVGEETIPIHKKINLSIKLFDIKDLNLSKLLLTRIDGKDISAVDSRVEEGYIKAKIRNFGVYGIMIDTIAPSIELKAKRLSKEKETISFKITDNLSGIDSYSAYLNGKWVLFKYDYKTNLYYYDKDYQLKKTNSNQTLEIKVSDKKGNISKKILQFIY